MAKIVIAAYAECLYFAKVELLAEKLHRSLPNFSYRTVIVDESEWENYVESLQNQWGWTVKKSPVVWRELVDRGGKGYLIGGANEFQEYARSYYGVDSELTTEDLKKIAPENRNEFEDKNKDEEIFRQRIRLDTVCVTITNEAQLRMVNVLASEISKGLLGDLKQVRLLYYVRPNKNSTEEAIEPSNLDGLVMETMDLAGPALRECFVVNDPVAAFSNSAAVVAFYQTSTPVEVDEVQPTSFQQPATESTIDDEQRYKKNRQQLEEMEVYFHEFGTDLEKHGKASLKVVVFTEDLLNFAVTVLTEQLCRVAKNNVLGVSRLLENQVKSVLAAKMQAHRVSDYRKLMDFSISGGDLRNVHLNGNPGLRTGICSIDLSKARLMEKTGAVREIDSYTVPVASALYEPKWLLKEFPAALRSYTSSRVSAGCEMAAGAAVSSLLGDWVCGSDKRWTHSVVAVSQGQYSTIPDGLASSCIASFQPPGSWNRVQDVQLSSSARETIKKAVQELQEQLYTVYPKRRPFKEGLLEALVGPVIVISTTDADKEAAESDVTLTAGTAEAAETAEVSENATSGAEASEKENNQDEPAEDGLAADTNPLSEDTTAIKQEPNEAEANE